MFRDGHISAWRPLPRRLVHRRLFRQPTREIDPKTLRKYFPQDLERGSVEATAKVAQSLFQMATSGQSVAAAIFWMKARAGWREKHEVQIAPSSDLSQLTDEQLEQMLAHYEEEIRLARNSEPPLIDGAVDTSAF